MQIKIIATVLITVHPDQLTNGKDRLLGHLAENNGESAWTDLVAAHDDEDASFECRVKEVLQKITLNVKQRHIDAAKAARETMEWNVIRQCPIMQAANEQGLAKRWSELLTRVHFNDQEPLWKYAGDFDNRREVQPKTFNLTLVS